MRPLKSLVLIGLLAALVLALTPASAPARVPPKDCGFMKVDGKRFNVRSDQLRCRPARRYAKRYLDRGRRPRGYRCKDYGRETAIEFRCSKGDAVFFAIRR